MEKIITNKSEHKKPYLQMGNLAPLWTMDMDSTSVDILTSYITSISMYLKFSVARFHSTSALTLCCHRKNSAQAAQALGT